MRISEPAACLDPSGLRLIAISIETTGAFAVFNSGGMMVDVYDLPIVHDGLTCRPIIDASALGEALRIWEPEAAVIQDVAAQPEERPLETFALGRCRGIVEGSLAALAVPVRFVVPSWWQPRVGIASDDMKNKAQSIARSRWPGLSDRFVRDVHKERAEAALLGAAFLEAFSAEVAGST